MENSFHLSTRDPTSREDFGAGGEADIDQAVDYAQRRAEDDRIRRRVEQYRQEKAQNYWRENLVRVKGASRGNYCRRKYGQQAREMNAVPVFKDEECRGRPHATYREHPEIPGLQVEDVCTLCVQEQARAVYNEAGQWVASEFTRKAGINRGTGAGGEEEEYAQLRTPPARTRAVPAPRIQTPPAAAAAAAAGGAGGMGMVRVEQVAGGEHVVDEEEQWRRERRQQFYTQRSARRDSARRTSDSSRPQQQPPQIQTRFGMSLFTNKTPAPVSVFQNKTSKTSSRKKKSTQRRRK